MWADNETDQDLLGFSIHVQLVRSIITNPKMLPVTVGLFGDWGGSKSSILKMLQKEINNDENFAVIYFNGWVFEGYEDAKCAILTTLLNELREHRNLKEVIGDEVKALLKRVNWMKVLKMGASYGMAYLASNPLPALMAGNALAGTSSDSEKTDGAEPGISTGGILKPAEDIVQNVRSFREDFKKLVEKTRLKAVVILIDDLDRCSPERVIENLEAIKLFLNVDRTAFVVATDRRIVENAIRIRYSGLFADEERSAVAETLVTDYLEKLIQVPYTLPKLAPHEVRSYLCMLFLKKYLSDTEFADVASKYVQFISRERYASFQLGDELKAIADKGVQTAVAESMRLVDACSDAITDGLKGNPRQIKRFLNAFWLRRELAKIANLSHLKDHVMIKLMVLEYINTDRFDELYQWHRVSDDGTARPLAELEGAKSIDDIGDSYSSWRTARIVRWLKVDPKLAAEDLRDYFWVARSSVTDTFAGVRLMTQAMRTCGEDLISKLDTERKSGVVMFSDLSEDEQDGVLGLVTRHAMQETKEDAALRSLLDLSGAGFLNAAEAFGKCVDRIGASTISPGFGITLRAFTVNPGNRASEMVGKIREQLSKTDTQIGRTLKAKRKSGK